MTGIQCTKWYEKAKKKVVRILPPSREKVLKHFRKKYNRSSSRADATRSRTEVTV